MSIEFRRQDDVVIVDFRGYITIGDAVRRLKDGFNEALEAGQRRFVFNLARAPYIDSSTIGETIASLNRAKEVGGVIKFVVPDASRVRDVLRLTALEKVMEIYEDEEAALGSFAS